MNNYEFVGGLGILIFALLAWGVRTLPAERWQMMAAVPVTKNGNGAWRGLNLTFYGFFSATASTFGVALVIVLFASLGVPLWAAGGMVVSMMAICVPASKLVARTIERKSNTFTIAGAAFVGAVLLPPALLVVRKTLANRLDVRMDVLPIVAAVAITYALSEAIGRMACLSFGCCYGKPLRAVSPTMARLFARFHAVFYGDTKKAAYESRLAGEPLVPVQAITAIVFATAGLIGLGLFLAAAWRWAALVPIVATWGWRAIAESLRADHRGNSQVSEYQVMALVAILYLTAVVLLLPSDGPLPNLAAGLARLISGVAVVTFELLWAALFLYYGRSKVTASVLSFHVVAERV